MNFKGDITMKRSLISVIATLLAASAFGGDLVL